MNLERIQHLIKNPNLSESVDIHSLKELTIKYPYSQLFSILYLKALNTNKDIRFDEELNKFAYKISDRQKLYDLMYNISNETGSTVNENRENKEYVEFEKEIEFELIKEVEKHIELTENVINNSEISNPLNEIVKNENQLDESQIEINQIDEIQNSEIENSINKEIIIIENNLQINSEFEDSLPINKDIKSHKIDTDNLEKEFLANIISSGYSIENEEKTIEIKNTTENHLYQKKSFSSWLKTSINDSKSNSNENIIDEFISNNPKMSTIETKKNEFYSAPKKAKESISEEKLIYSETLANIYQMQGNYPKAILAFQQLMLTIPEKKLYFAEKIKELNKKIN